MRQLVYHRHQTRHVVTRDAELLSLLARLDIGVRRVDRHLGIHPDRNGRHDAVAARDGIDGHQLRFRFDVDQQDPLVERLLDLAYGLAHPAEDHIAADETGLAGTE